MRTRSLLCSLFAVALLLVWATALRADADVTKIQITVKSETGKPIDRASVIVRFEGRSIAKLGKKVRTSYELRTNQEGEANVPSIPTGTIRVQVIAKGYQTYGQLLEITEAEKQLDITLKPPQEQYSAH